MCSKPSGKDIRKLQEECCKWAELLMLTGQIVLLSMTVSVLLNNINPFPLDTFSGCLSQKHMHQQWAPIFFSSCHTIRNSFLAIGKSWWVHEFTLLILYCTLVFSDSSDTGPSPAPAETKPKLESVDDIEVNLI